MSQAQLLPTASPSVSLPSITFKGFPVVTTEMLAKAYGCKPQQIKQNFANNKERFAEGKHFYSLQNGELNDFRLQVENFDSQISLSPKARNLTLWLERGAARHAKMLNTDQAWDVFEMLEETFFRVVKPQPSTLTPSTADDRKPLRSLVHAWAQIAGTSHTALWPQVKAHFQLARIDDLPVEWIGDALAFVQGKIDAAGKALPLATQQAPPASKQPPYRSYAEVKSNLGGIQGAMMDAFFPFKKSLENINFRTIQAFNNPQRRDEIATEADITLKYLIRALFNARNAIEESVLSCNETLSGLIELAAVLENPQRASKPVRFGVQVF